VKKKKHSLIDVLTLVW